MARKRKLIETEDQPSEHNGHHETNGEHTEQPAEEQPPRSYAQQFLQSRRERTKPLRNPFPRDLRVFNDGESMTLLKPLGNREAYEIHFTGKPASETLQLLRNAIASFNEERNLPPEYDARFDNHSKSWKIEQAAQSVTLRTAQNDEITAVFGALAEMEAANRGGFDTRKTGPQQQVG